MLDIVLIEGQHFVCKNHHVEQGDNIPGVGATCELEPAEEFILSDM